MSRPTYDKRVSLEKELGEAEAKQGQRQQDLYEFRSNQKLLGQERHHRAYIDDADDPVITETLSEERRLKSAVAVAIQGVIALKARVAAARIEEDRKRQKLMQQKGKAYVKKRKASYGKLRRLGQVFAAAGGEADEALGDMFSTERSIAILHDARRTSGDKSDRKVLNDQMRALMQHIEEEEPSLDQETVLGFLAWMFLLWTRRTGSGCEELWPEAKRSPMPALGSSIVLDNELLILREGRLPLRPLHTIRSTYRV